MTVDDALAKARRLPCASCKQPILAGARKCKHCKAWQPEGPRAPRAAIIMFITLASVFSVIVTSKGSAVGKAPPLTAMGSPEGATSTEPANTAIELTPPAVTASAAAAIPLAQPRRKWTTREIRMGDVHPLDLAFSADGESLYVSADDASIREYRVATGEIVHKASVPVKGDRVELLFDHYLAVLRSDVHVARVPVMDVRRWDHDPVLLECGASPKDIHEMGDGSVVVATMDGHRVSKFTLPTGALEADIKLPQSTGQLFLVRSEGRPALAAIGAMTHAGRPAGAWIDLFDPAETPFGATRRSIPVGRDPRPGGVTSDGSVIFFPDFATNTASTLAMTGETDMRSADVGQGPIAGFVLAGDRYGVTLNATAKTASVVDLATPESSERLRVTTLMLSAEPRMGRLSPDRTLLFVSLGGREDPPRGEGVAIIGGDPPQVLATLPTGKGAESVTIAKDGKRAAVANYFAKSITVLE